MLPMILLVLKAGSICKDSAGGSLSLSPTDLFSVGKHSGVSQDRVTQDGSIHNTLTQRQQNAAITSKKLEPKVRRR